MGLWYFPPCRRHPATADPVNGEMTMASDSNQPIDAMYDRAAEIAERHLDAALQEAGALEYLVAVMMVEASVNAAVESTSHEDVVRLLRDLTKQIEDDIED